MSWPAGSMLNGREPADPALSARAASPLGLPQRLVKHCPEDQRCLDCEVRVVRLTARRGPGCRPPSFNGIVTEPDRQRAPLSQPGLVVSPVRHLVAGFRNPMAAVGIVFVRHGQAERSGRGAPSIQCQPPEQPPHPCTKLTYIANNAAALPDYSERWFNGERISTAFAESTVNLVVSRRFAKKQQMQWSKQGAHRLLQTRTKALDGTLRDLFTTWYPAMAANDNQVPALAMAV